MNIQFLYIKTYTICQIGHFQSVRIVKSRNLIHNNILNNHFSTCIPLNMLHNHHYGPLSTKRSGSKESNVPRVTNSDLADLQSPPGPTPMKHHNDQHNSTVKGQRRQLSLQGSKKLTDVHLKYKEQMNVVEMAAQNAGSQEVAPARQSMDLAEGQTDHAATPQQRPNQVSYALSKISAKSYTSNQNAVGQVPPSAVNTPIVITDLSNNIGNLNVDHDADPQQNSIFSNFKRQVSPRNRVNKSLLIRRIQRENRDNFEHLKDQLNEEMMHDQNYLTSIRYALSQGLIDEEEHEGLLKVASTIWAQEAKENSWTNHLIDSKRNKNITERRRERTKKVNKQVTVPASGGAGGIHVASPRPRAQRHLDSLHELWQTHQMRKDYIDTFRRNGPTETNLIPINELMLEFGRKYSSIDPQMRANRLMFEADFGKNWSKKPLQILQNCVSKGVGVNVAPPFDSKGVGGSSSQMSDSRRVQGPVKLHLQTLPSSPSNLIHQGSKDRHSTSLLAQQQPSPHNNSSQHPSILPQHQPKDGSRREQSTRLVNAVSGGGSPSLTVMLPSSTKNIGRYKVNGSSDHFGDLAPGVDAPTARAKISPTESGTIPQAGSGRASPRTVKGIVSQIVKSKKRKDEIMLEGKKVSIEIGHALSKENIRQQSLLIHQLVNDNSHLKSGYTEMTEEVECDMREKFGDGKSKFPSSKQKLEQDFGSNHPHTVSRKNSPTFFKHQIQESQRQMTHEELDESDQLPDQNMEPVKADFGIQTIDFQAQTDDSMNRKSVDSHSSNELLHSNEKKHVDEGQLQEQAYLDQLLLNNSENRNVELDETSKPSGPHTNKFTASSNTGLITPISMQGHVFRKDGEIELEGCTPSADQKLQQQLKYLRDPKLKLTIRKNSMSPHTNKAAPSGGKYGESSPMTGDFHQQASGLDISPTQISHDGYIINHLMQDATNSRGPKAFRLKTSQEKSPLLRKDTRSPNASPTTKLKKVLNQINDHTAEQDKIEQLKKDEIKEELREQDTDVKNRREPSQVDEVYDQCASFGDLQLMKIKNSYIESIQNFDHIRQRLGTLDNDQHRMFETFSRDIRSAQDYANSFAVQSYGQDLGHSQFLSNMDVMQGQVTPNQSNYFGLYQQYYQSMGYPEKAEQVPDINELLQSVQSAFMKRRQTTLEKNRRLDEILPRIGTSENVSRLNPISNFQTSPVSVRSQQDAERGRGLPQVNNQNKMAYTAQNFLTTNLNSQRDADHDVANDTAFSFAFQGKAKHKAAMSKTQQNFPQMTPTTKTAISSQSRPFGGQKKSQLVVDQIAKTIDTATSRNNQGGVPYPQVQKYQSLTPNAASANIQGSQRRKQYESFEKSNNSQSLYYDTFAVNTPNQLGGPYQEIRRAKFQDNNHEESLKSLVCSEDGKTQKDRKNDEDQTKRDLHTPHDHSTLQSKFTTARGKKQEFLNYYNSAQLQDLKSRKKSVQPQLRHSEFDYSMQYNSQIQSQHLLNRFRIQGKMSSTPTSLDHPSLASPNYLGGLPLLIIKKFHNKDKSVYEKYHKQLQKQFLENCDVMNIGPQKQKAKNEKESPKIKTGGAAIKFAEKSNYTSQAIKQTLMNVQSGQFSQERVNLKGDPDQFGPFVLERNTSGGLAENSPGPNELSSLLDNAPTQYMNPSNMSFIQDKAKPNIDQDLQLEKSQINQISSASMSQKLIQSKSQSPQNESEEPPLCSQTIDQRNHGKISPNFFQPDKMQSKKPFSIKKRSEFESDYRKKSVCEIIDQDFTSRHENSTEMNAPSPELMIAKFSKQNADQTKTSHYNYSDLSNRHQVFTPNNSEKPKVGAHNSFLKQKIHEQGKTSRKHQGATSHIHVEDVARKKQEDFKQRNRVILGSTSINNENQTKVGSLRDRITQIYQKEQLKQLRSTSPRHVNHRPWLTHQPLKKLYGPMNSNISFKNSNLEQSFAHISSAALSPLEIRTPRGYALGSIAGSIASFADSTGRHRNATVAQPADQTVTLQIKLMKATKDNNMHMQYPMMQYNNKIKVVNNQQQNNNNKAPPGSINHARLKQIMNLQEKAKILNLKDSRRSSPKGAPLKGTKKASPRFQPTSPIKLMNTMHLNSNMTIETEAISPHLLTHFDH